MRRVEKLNISASDSGVRLDIDGASEGIHIEYSILPEVAGAIIREILGRRDTCQDSC